MDRINFKAAFWVVASLVSVGVANAQEFKVRTERAPFFVGEPIALEIDAVDFEVQPEIKIKNADQDQVRVTFRNQGRSESTRIFQSGGKFVRERTVKTTFYYQVEFEAAGTYTIGPFETTVDGKTVTHKAITYKVTDIETTSDMQVRIELPSGNLYPGQHVPVKLRWMYAGDVSGVSGLTIRTQLFDRFRFVGDQSIRGQNAIPITTAKGLLRFPAEFKNETIDGKQFIVGTLTRTMVPETPEKVELPPTFVSFRKIVGRARSNDIFDNFFDQPETVPVKGMGFPVKFEIKPFPMKNRPASFSGAVGQKFQISTSLNRSNVRTGDPLTLQINIEGEGNVGSIRIPKLDTHFSKADFDFPDGDAPGIPTPTQKQFNVSIRVKSESVKEVPPIEFAWFDPVEEKYHSATSKPIPIDVKKGVLVSSSDVFSTQSDSAVGETQIDDEAKVDLSIQTDVKKLTYREEQSGIWVWVFYAAGMGLLGLTMAVVRLKQKPSEEKIHRKSVVDCCHEIRTLKNQLDGGHEFAKLLSEKLRKLNALLSEFESDENSKAIDGELDQLISDCDSVSYQPNEPTSQQLATLMESANNIIKELS